jgi:hypothetical protein
MSRHNSVTSHMICRALRHAYFHQQHAIQWHNPYTHSPFLLTKILELSAQGRHKALAMSEAVSHISTAVARIQSQACTCGICGGQSGTRAGVPPSTSVFPPRSLQHHHQRYLISAFNGVVKQNTQEKDINAKFLLPLPRFLGTL